MCNACGAHLAQVLAGLGDHVGAHERQRAARRRGGAEGARVVHQDDITHAAQRRQRQRLRLASQHVRPNF